jgi:hypothetical protein
MDKNIIVDFSGNNALALGFNVIWNKLQEPNYKLLQLLNDSSFEFKNAAFSSRMLNHYEQNGWVVADRNNPIGKRRFSLLGMLFLNLNVECYGIFARYNLKSTTRFEVRLNSHSFPLAINESHITVFDLIVLLSLLMYNIELISIAIREDNENIYVTLNSASNNSFPLSIDVFRYLENYSNEIAGYSKLKISKSSNEFFTEFVYHIDELRNKLGTNLLCPRLYNQVKGKKLLLFNQGHRKIVAETRLFTIGECIMNHIKNPNRKLVIDDAGNCFSIDVKYLGKVNFVKQILGGRKLEKINAVFVPEVI